MQIRGAGQRWGKGGDLAALQGSAALTSALLISVYFSEKGHVQALLLCTADILSVLLCRFNAEEAVIMIFITITAEVDFHLIYESGLSTF